jgi:hypothetical protein
VATGCKILISELLRAAKGFGRIPRAGLFNEGLHLAALNAFGQILLARAVGAFVRRGNAGLERGGSAPCGIDFNQCRRAIDDLDRSAILCKECLAFPHAKARCGQRGLEGMQLAERGFQDQALLLLFDGAHAQEAKECG